MIITIDGPAGTGKSTVARKLAQRLNLPYFNTGALYRSFTWYVNELGIDPSNKDDMKTALRRFAAIFHFDPHANRYFVGDDEVTEAIRTPEITNKVSEIAAHGYIRDGMVPIQHDFGDEHPGSVFEGRDIGTVVFPDAELKIFLTATPEVRAERRLKEFREKDPSITFDLVLKEIMTRDEYDSNRKVAPLRQADDAILVDTSHLNVEQVVEQIVRYYQDRLEV